MPRLLEIQFSQFKALRRFTLRLGPLTLLTGANNAGKSTALSALRLLDLALAHAGRRVPLRLATPTGRTLGWSVPTARLAVSLANVHTDLEDVETTLRFVYDHDDNDLLLTFPADGGCLLTVPGDRPPPRRPAELRARFPQRIVAVPVLGPLENDEPIVQEATVRRGLRTHRASRHFRNHWAQNPAGFPAFAALLAQTWPGMRIEPPERSFVGDTAALHMFCQEHRATRELYWCGFGFQIWCQLLTHISRAGPGDLLLIDEPETYLHPRVQRQLLQILRDTGAQVVLASHATTLIASAAAGEVRGIDRAAGEDRVHPETGIALCQRLGLLPAPGPDGVEWR